MSQLEKGKQLQVTLHLTRRFDLSVPGSYELSAARDGRLVKTEKSILVKSDPIETSVTEGDSQPRP